MYKVLEFIGTLIGIVFLATMAWIFLILFLSAINVAAKADTLKVAVIDTGYDFDSYYGWDQPGVNELVGLTKPKLCKDGHMDFTNSSNKPMDHHGHGTHIAGIIAKGNADINYCLIIIKYYDPDSSANNNLMNTKKAFAWAILQHVDIINYSGGGIEPSDQERQLVFEAIRRGIEVVVAAGNEATEITRGTAHCYYPACYSPLIDVVGATKGEPTTFEPPDSERQPASNHGPAVNYYEDGKKVFSILPGGNYGYMTGTSQATANHTRKLVNGLYRVNKFDRLDARKYLKSYRPKLVC